MIRPSSKVIVKFLEVMQAKSAFLWGGMGLESDARTIALQNLTCPLRPPQSSRADYIGEFEIVDDHRSGKIVVEVRACIAADVLTRGLCLARRPPPDVPLPVNLPPCSLSAASTSAA